MVLGLLAPARFFQFIEKMIRSAYEYIWPTGSYLHHANKITPILQYYMQGRYNTVYGHKPPVVK